MSSILQIVQSNSALAATDPQSILGAALTAADLDLPVNQSLGYFYIVSFKGKAQFQIGWRGFVQLAIRSAQYQNINVISVFQNQFKGFDPLKEQADVDFSIEPNGKAIGYIACFKLINGFEKTIYWSREKVEAHAKYSQFKKQASLTMER